MGSIKNTSPRVIVALDYADETAVYELAAQLDPSQCRLKVGKELFTAFGPAVVRGLVDQGFDVFLDLKFHDIPNTVARAVTMAADLGVWMVNVHASGGRRMMMAAREAINHCDHQPLLIAVTVLTSMEQGDLQEVGVEDSPEQQVLRLARLTRDCELDGVVCSGQEVPLLKKEIAAPFCTVTPGIRPATFGSDDQRRVLTPAEAIRQGSDYLVIGRPITRARDPLSVLKGINEEISLPA